MNLLRTIATLSILPLGLAACQQASEPANEATSPTSTTAAGTAGITLPISINAAMVGLVDHSADYIFALGNGDMPRNEHDWNLVRNSAFEMMLSGTVIQIPGTGEFDEQWTQDPAWKSLSQQLTDIGAEALALAESKSTNQEEWRKVGDKLIQNCLACHQKFKPEIPSDGVLRGSTERQSRGISIFGF